MALDVGSEITERIDEDLEGCEEEIPGIMVFQCNKCSTILGDTMTWVDGNTELGTFTIRRVTDDVELGKTIRASQEGIDEGSTYKDIRCASCKSQVGRFYLATTSPVDHLRSMYTLYVSSIKVYNLNSGRVDKDSSMVLTAGDLPFLNLHELTLHVRKIQGIIIHICNTLGKVCASQNIPLDPALLFSQNRAPSGNDDGNQEAHPETPSDKKDKSGKRQKVANSSINGCASSTDSDTGLQRKRERSRTLEKSESFSSSGQRNKKHKH